MKCFLPMLRSRYLAVAGLAFSLLSLAACDVEGFLLSVSGNKEVRVAVDYLEMLRKGDLAAFRETIPDQQKSYFTEKAAADIAAGFPSDQLQRRELAGYYYANNNGIVVYNMSFEYEFQSAWTVASIMLEKSGDRFWTRGVSAEKRTESLRQTNRFTLIGKRPRHYLVLALSIAAPLFSLATLVAIVRTPIVRRKWLWIVACLLGFCTLSINWTTGEYGVAPISFQLLSAGISSQGPFTPWILKASLPLGAIAFWIWRRRLMARPEQAPELPA